MRLQQSAFASFAPLVSHPLFDAKSPNSAKNSQLMTENPFRRHRATTIWALCGQFAAKSALWEPQTDLTKRQKRSGHELDGCRSNTRFTFSLRGFPPNISTRGLRIRMAAAAMGPTVAPHAASGRWVPCGAPMMPPPPIRPPSPTWPFALAAAGSAAFPSTATPPLDNWAPIVLSFRRSEQKKRKRKIEKEKSPKSFWRFKNPALGLAWGLAPRRWGKKRNGSPSFENLDSERAPLSESVNPTVDELKLKDGRQTPVSISTAPRNRPETPPPGRGAGLRPICARRGLDLPLPLSLKQPLNHRLWLQDIYCFNRMKLNFIVNWWRVILQNLVSIH